MLKLQGLWGIKGKIAIGPSLPGVGLSMAERTFIPPFFGFVKRERKEGLGHRVRRE